MYKTIMAALLILFINVPANGKTLGYEDSLSATVGSIVKGAKDKSIQKIAVINFIDTTSKQRFLLSDILEEDFTTKLIQSKRFDVIVKNRINVILSELKFGYDGMTNPEKVKQFGQLSQADAILTGTYRIKNNNIVINTQLINVESGEALWAGSLTVPKTEFPAEAFQFPNVYQEMPTATFNKEKAIPPKPTGELSVMSNPQGAEIYLDAKIIGRTPAIIHSVLSGSRNITLILDGYEDHSEDINVQPNNTTTINVAMRKKIGDISVETSPDGATVYIDGYERGTSPCTIKDLIVGIHKIKIKKRNYLSCEEDININYKRLLDKKYILKGEPGSLLVRSDPLGAQVIIDNEAMGVTPLSLENKIAAGEHTVQVILVGYEPYNQDFIISPNKGETINPVLNKIALETSVHGKYFRKVSLNCKYEIVGKYPIPDELAAKVNCYHFIYNEQGKLIKVEYRKCGKLQEDCLFYVAQIIIDYSDGYEKRIFQDANGNPMAESFMGLSSTSIFESIGAYSIRLKLDANNHPIALFNYDKEGKLAEDLYGVAQFQWILDEKGRSIIQISKDLYGGNPSIDLKFKYDERGNIIEKSNYSVNGEIGPFLKKLYGDVTVRMKYDEQGNNIEESNYDADKKLTAEYYGYAIIRRQYDEQGNIIEGSFYGADKKLIEAKDYGTAIGRMKYDEQGNEIEVSYYGADKQLKEDKPHGIAIIQTKYDEQGNEIDVNYYGVDGQLKESKLDGVAIYRYEYDENGNKVKTISLDRNENIIKTENN